MSSRREILKHLIVGGASVAVASPELFTRQALGLGFLEDDPWQTVMPGILARIKAPVFPKRDFDITKFGAKADGTTDSTQAFKQAISACNKAGGGRVVVPAGTFLTGAIHLKSNVNLFVS